MKLATAGVNLEELSSEVEAELMNFVLHQSVLEYYKDLALIGKGMDKEGIQKIEDIYRSKVYAWLKLTGGDLVEQVKKYEEDIGSKDFVLTQVGPEQMVLNIRKRKNVPKKR